LNFNGVVFLKCFIKSPDLYHSRDLKEDVSDRDVIPKG